MAEKQVVIETPLAYPNHGNTVASWTMVIVMVVGAIIAAVGFDTFNWPVMIAGTVVIALGIVAGLVLKSMGYGQGGSKTRYKKH